MSAHRPEIEAQLAEPNDRPRVYAAPVSAYSAGAEVIDFAAGFGLKLDEWQRWVTVQSMGETGERAWTSLEVGLVAPRQNGKDVILEARALTGLYHFRERLVLYTSHQFKTSGESFIRIRDWVTNCDALRRRVKRVIGSHGEEGIELTDGSRLRFIARSRTSGRGFTGDLIILNEAFELPEAAMAATVPTLSARPRAQIWYASTAPDREKDFNAITLTRVRNRALSGDTDRLSYFEWGLDPGEADANERKALRADPRAWKRANPNFGVRISADFVRNVELAQFTPRSFDTERLGIGDWPVDEDAGWLVISEKNWEGLADHSHPARPAVVTFAVEVAWDRSFAIIAAWGRRPDGRGQAEIVDQRPGTDWVLERLAELQERHNPVAIAIDGGGPARSLIPFLDEAGIKTWSPGLREIAGTCGALVDEAAPEVRGWRHLDQAELNLAAAFARRRDLGDIWLWERRGAPGTPLMAVSVARCAYDKFAPSMRTAEPGVWVL